LYSSALVVVVTFAAGAGVVGIDTFVLLVSPGVLMCGLYLSAMALVVVVAFALTLVVLAWGAGVPC